MVSIKSKISNGSTDASIRPVCFVSSHQTKYDKFLSKCNNSIKVGLSFEEPYHQIITVNNFDCKLDYCITPNKVYNFKKLIWSTTIRRCSSF